MPVVIVPDRPNGLPMATTICPTCSASESPSGSGSRAGVSAGSTLSTARSLSGSEPTSSALTCVPSAKMTAIRTASPATWWLVMICPAVS